MVSKVKQDHVATWRSSRFFTYVSYFSSPPLSLLVRATLISCLDHTLSFEPASTPFVHPLNLCDFPDSSLGKESAYNAGDPGLIPGSGRFPGEGVGYPLQYSWSSLVSQQVKNWPVMQETWARLLSFEDPLEKRNATHSSILVWRIPWTV